MILTKNHGDRAIARPRQPDVAGTAVRHARAETIALACCVAVGGALATPVKHAPVRHAPAKAASKTAHAPAQAPAANATASASPTGGSPVPTSPPTYPAWNATAATAAVATPVVAAAMTSVAPAASAPSSDTAAGNMVRYLDQRGLLDPVNTVATRSTELFTQVRDRTTGLVTSAMNFIGVPYKHGGNSVDTGFDCSGFTRHVFENSIGLLLPHRADEQAKEPSLLKVDLKDLKPGDLVFFNTMRRTFSHVGIYLGEGRFIHSPRTGESVRVEDMRISYWARRFTGARRVPGLDADGAAPSATMLAANLNASLAPTLSPSLAPVAGTGAAASLGVPPLLAAPGSDLPRVGPVAAPRPAAATSLAARPGVAPPLGER